MSNVQEGQPESQPGGAEEAAQAKKRIVLLLLQQLALLCVGLAFGWYLSTLFYSKNKSPEEVQLLVAKAVQDTKTFCEKPVEPKPKVSAKKPPTRKNVVDREKANRATDALVAQAVANAEAKKQALTRLPYPETKPTVSENKKVEAGGKFWGWVHPESTSQKKMPCFTDRKIFGKPEQCSFVEVFPRISMETEEQWNARVAERNNIAKGIRDSKGVISETTFAHINVK